MHDIEVDLPNHKCKTCKQLSYYDWYLCKIGKHSTKLGFLHMGRLTKCTSYEKRHGTNWESCKTQECILWCNNCPANKNK